jgi:hypothetical protein
MLALAGKPIVVHDGSNMTLLGSYAFEVGKPI